MTQHKTTFGGVDILRFLAAVMVMFYHYGFWVWAYPDGISARVLDVTRNVVKIQTGYLYHYAFAMLIGAAGLITWFMFGFGGQ